MEIKVKGKNGANKYSIRKLTYSGQHMGNCTCTVDFESAEPIDFSIGDWFQYRGDIFTLRNIPTAKKQGAKKAYGKSFEYKSVVFNSTIDELSECPFADYVGVSSSTKFTAMPQFSFLASTIHTLAERIQVNLDKMYGNGVWTVSVTQGWRKERTENKVISINNQSVWDALSLVVSEYDEHFFVRGRTITLCTNGADIQDLTFAYGKGNGCYDIERTTNQSQKVVTRLTSYGDSKNIIARYYAMYNAKVKSNVTIVYNAYLTNRLFLRFRNQSAFLHNITFVIGSNQFNASFVDGENLQSSVIGNVYEVSDTSSKKTWLFNYLVGSNSPTETTPDYNEYQNLVRTDATILSGVDKSEVSGDDIIIDSSIGYPNNLNVTNLMLPAFPAQTLNDWVTANKSKYQWLLQAVNDGYTFSSEQFNPYIMSKNYVLLGDHPHYEFFTTDDVDHKDIYPSVEMGGDNTIVSVTNEDGSAITDSGIYPPSIYSTIPKIIIKIGDLGFDFADVKIKDTNPKLTMKDGACGARTFEVLAYYRKGSGWELTCNRIYDDTLKIYFPYVGGKMEAGDKFVITDINMPDSYVQAASVELLKWSIEWLRRNDYTVYNYKLTPDEIHIQRHDDAVIADGGQESDTFHYKIKEGDYLHISDADLGFSGAVTIQSLTIKEGEGLLPKYEIALSEVKNVGTIKMMQNQINGLSASIQSLGSTSGSSGSNVQILKTTDSDQPSDLNVYSASRSDKQFLRKDKSDTISGNLGVNGNISVTGNASVEGESVTKNITNSGTIETKNLNVSGSAHFFELTIDKVNATYGQDIQSAGAAKIDHAVKNDDDTFTLYYRKDNGEESITSNRFEANDLILCQNFNTAKIGEGSGVGNTHIWMRLQSVGEAVVGDYEYWTITTYPILTTSGSDTNGAYYKDSQMNGVKFTTEVPDEDDFVGLTFAVFGNTSNTARQSAILRSSLNDTFLNPTYDGSRLYAPMQIHYVRINSYLFNDSNYNKIESRDKSLFVGELKIKSDTGTTQPIKNESGRETRYNVSSSVEDIPDTPTTNAEFEDDWEEDVPTMTEENPVLWKCLQISYTDGTYSWAVEYSDELLKGDKGDKGDEGEDAINLVILKSFVTSTVSKNEFNQFCFTAYNGGQVALYKGNTKITSGVTWRAVYDRIPSKTGTKTINPTNGVAYVSVSASDYVQSVINTAVIGGEEVTTETPATDCGVTVTATYSGNTYSTYLPINIDYSKQWGEFILNSEEMKNTLVNAEGDISILKQTAEGFEFKVGQMGKGKRNLVPYGYIRQMFGKVMTGEYRTLQLKSGHKYILSANGMCNTAATDVYGVVHLYRGSWENKYSLDFSTTTEMTTKSVFVEADSDAYYTINIYGNNTSNGYMYLEYIQVEDVTEAWNSITDKPTTTAKKNEWAKLAVSPYSQCVTDKVQPNIADWEYGEEFETKSTAVIDDKEMEYWTFKRRYRGTSKPTTSIQVGDFYKRMNGSVRSWYVYDGTEWLNFFNSESDEIYVQPFTHTFGDLPLGTYTVSFYAKGSDMVEVSNVITYMINAYGYVVDNVISKGIGCNSNGSNLPNDNWRKFIITFSHNGGSSGTICPMRMYLNESVGITRVLHITYPKFERYGMATESDADLLATGIDIEKKKITLTADNVTFQDNQGDLMAVINGEGVKAKSVTTENVDTGAQVSIADGVAIFKQGSGNIEIGVSPDGKPTIYAYDVDENGAKTMLWYINQQGIQTSDGYLSSWFDQSAFHSLYLERTSASIPTWNMFVYAPPINIKNNYSTSVNIERQRVYLQVSVGTNGIGSDDIVSTRKVFISDSPISLDRDESILKQTSDWITQDGVDRGYTSVGQISGWDYVGVNFYCTISIYVQESGKMYPTMLNRYVYTTKASN